MTNILTTYSLRFVFLLLLQVLVLNHINFLGHINPYLYIFFILFFPVKNNRTIFLLISFLLGLLVDVFSDSGGIHAAAAVTIAFIRPAVLKFCFGTVYEYQNIKFSTTELGSRLTYIVILTCIHHFILFSLEVFNIIDIALILKKTVFSSIFTIILCLISSILFSRKT